MSGNKVQVKKVKAFPFPASVKIGTGVLPGQVMKLTVQGFLVEFSLKTIKPGDKIEITFELPVLKHSITEACVVVKLYNQWALSSSGADSASPAVPPKDAKVAAQTPAAGVAPAKVTQLVECHFLNLNSSSRERIQSFLNAVGRMSAK